MIWSQMLAVADNDAHFEQKQQNTKLTGMWGPQKDTSQRLQDTDSLRSPLFVQSTQAKVITKIANQVVE